jgi:hypothetical protein
MIWFSLALIALLCILFNLYQKYKIVLKENLELKDAFAKIGECISNYHDNN